MPPGGCEEWIDTVIRGRSLHTLEHKEAVAKFRIFSVHNCLVHHLKRMNLNKTWVDIDIRGRSLHTLEHKEAVAKFLVK